MHYIHSITRIIYDISSSLYDVTITMCVTSHNVPIYGIKHYMFMLYSLDMASGTVLWPQNHCVPSQPLCLTLHSMYFWHFTQYNNFLKRSVLGFLFCSFGLYFCLCASTILWWLWLCNRAWSQAGWFLQFHSSFWRLLWLFEVFCISIQIVKLFVLVLWKIPLVVWQGLHWIYRLLWVVYSASNLDAGGPAHLIIKRPQSISGWEEWVSWCNCNTVAIVCSGTECIRLLS